MKNRYPLIYFALIVLVSTILLTQTSVAAFKNVTVGSVAPNITLKDLDGKEVSLEAIYNENKTVILLFWATWSPRAVAELKDLQELLNSYKEKGLAIVAVNADNEDISSEDVTKIKDIAKENGITFTILLDEGLKTFRGYGVVAVPSTAIIKQGGEILKDYASYATFAKNEIKDNVEYELGIKERPKEVEVAEAEKKYKPLKASLLHYGLGKTLIARGMPDKAIREFLKAAELDEKFSMPHVGLGEVYYSQAKKQKKKAKKEELLTNSKNEFLKAIEIEPESLPALSGIALVLIDEKKDAEAEKHITTVLDIEPNFTPALSAMGILLKNKGEPDKAIEKFDAALELNPNQPEVYYLKAMTYQKSGDNENAIKNLKQSFKILLKQVSLAMMQEH